MGNQRFDDLVGRVSAAGRPVMEWITRRPPVNRVGNRVGVFASSFNPPTLAHMAMINTAAVQFKLDEVLALASTANADKLEYDCPLVDRLDMLTAAQANSDLVSIGLISTGYFVDMLDALREGYLAEGVDPELFFIVGLDTLERILDPAGLYFQRYHRKVSGPIEAIEGLLADARLIVAGRAGRAKNEFDELLLEFSADLASGILFMELPGDLGHHSASLVRERIRAGEEITNMVPEPVEAIIQERGLYGAAGHR